MTFTRHLNPEAGSSSSSRQRSSNPRKSPIAQKTARMGRNPRAGNRAEMPVKVHQPPSFPDKLEETGAGEAGAMACGPAVGHAGAGDGRLSPMPRKTVSGRLLNKGTPAAIVEQEPPASTLEASPAEGISNKNPSSEVVRHPEYRLSPRVLLQAGDKIRVSAGPYYESRDLAGNAVRMKMAERGVMTFLGYGESGTSRWIEARGKAGFAALHIGPEEISGEIPGLIRRPYKIRKVRVKNRPGGSVQPRRRTKAGRTPARPRSRKARLRGGI